MYFEAEKAKDKPHQSLGKLFHKYLENKKDFVVSPDVLPEPGVIKVIDSVFDHRKDWCILLEIDTNSYDWFKGAWPLMGAVVVGEARQVGYQPKWGDDAIWKKVGAEGEGYWKFLCEAQGHHMLTSKQKEQFEGMSTSILSSPWAEIVFDKKAEHEVPVLFKVTYDGEDIWCKALLDWVIMKENAIRVIDYKTTSKPIGSFMESNRVEMHLGENGWYEMRKPVPGSYWNYRYYRQLAFYTLAASELYVQRFQQPAPIGHAPEVLPIESVAPYECDLIAPPTTSGFIGRAEMADCFTEVAKYYKTLKKY